MRLAVVLAAMFVLAGCAAGSMPLATQQHNLITLAEIEQMFADIREQTDWNIDGDMLWGYFFTNRDTEPLQAAASKLEQLGYTVVGIREDEDGTFYWLHVERIETHSPQPLDRRNQELYALAAEFQLDSYDGMDVGPVPVAL